MNGDSLQDSKRKRLLVLNEAKCIGCHCCEVACMLEHDLQGDSWFLKVVPIGPLSDGQNLVMTYQVLKCFHCDRPACIDACLTGAMQKRKDGIVFSDPDVCIGCRSCSYACPFGIPQLNPATGKIGKCDECVERVEHGLSPSCVASCPTGALRFGSTLGTVQELRRTTARRIARTFAVEVPS